MGTNEDLRFERAIKARVRLKLAESKLAIQGGEWIERGKGLAAVFGIRWDVGDTLAPPASLGRTRPYFPREEWGSPEHERVNAEIDRDYREYLSRCEAFAAIAERITIPPMPERPTLDGELAEVDAKLAGDPDNVTLAGLRCHVIERQRLLKKRVDATLPRQWLEALVIAVGAEVEKFTGIQQTATLPSPLDNETGWIRSMGCRE